MASCALCNEPVERADQPEGAEICNACSWYLNARFSDSEVGHVATLADMTARWLSWCALHPHQLPIERVPELLHSVALEEREACARIADPSEMLLSGPTHGAWERGYISARKEISDHIRNPVKRGSASPVPDDPPARAGEPDADRNNGRDK